MLCDHLVRLEVTVPTTHCSLPHVTLNVNLDILLKHQSLASEKQVWGGGFPCTLVKSTDMGKGTEVPKKEREPYKSKNKYDRHLLFLLSMTE